MTSSVRFLGAKRKGFTLIELLVVIAIIAVLMGLLIPAVSSVREAANRSTCQNNLKQLGLAINGIHTARGVFPPAGEFLYDSGGGVLKQTQNLQSPFVLMLPYLEKSDIYDQMNVAKRYNDPTVPANQVAAKAIVNTFLCPNNPLRDKRTNGDRDSSGYGVSDYAPCPYTNVTTDPAAFDLTKSPTTPASGSAFLAAAGMMSSPIPLVAMTPTPADPNITNVDHIDATVTPDPWYGAANMGSVKDGLSYSLAFYEDVGRNETMASSRYLDPVTGGSRSSWRWAEPDNASGISKGVNTNRSPFGGPSGCLWVNHDCGPNNEVFSFHPGGANAVMMDGSVRFLSQDINHTVLRALATRAGGSSEAALYADAFR